MKIKGDNVYNSTSKVVKFYINVVIGIAIEVITAGLKSFTLFHKLPTSIDLLWENTEYPLDAQSSKFSFATLTWL